MPMPPPKPTHRGPTRPPGHARDHQLVRALQAHGPQSPEDLALRVGAPYWETGRFERALQYALADGLVVRTADKLFASV